MSVCVYDNPNTCCREAWQDGKLLCHISWALVEGKGFEGHSGIFFGLNVGRRIVPGQIVGDVIAIDQMERPYRVHT